MNGDKILEEINKTKEHLANMENMLAECEYERWKPKEGKTYFYIISTGEVGQDLWNRPFALDEEQRYNFYNCFQTYEQAKAEAEKISIRRELEYIARRLNRGGKIDWEDCGQSKYSIDLYHNDIYANVSYRYKNQGTVYCLDKNFKDMAIKEIGEERLKKYLRGE